MPETIKGMIQLNNIFEGSEKATAEMERVFRDHEQLETVIVNPNSWVGKELLLQHKRLMDLRDEVHSLTNSINLLNRNVTKLLDNSKN